MYDDTNPTHQRWRIGHQRDWDAAEQARNARTHAERGDGVPAEQWPDTLEQRHRDGKVKLQYLEGKKRMKRLLRGTGLKG